MKKPYPQNLLPQRNYKVIENISLLKDHVLVHFTDSKEIIDVSGRLDPSFVTRNNNSELRDYSNNLLGEFKLKHIFIKINNKSKSGYFVNLWKGDEDVLKPKYGIDFNLDNKRGHFFLKIVDCLNVKIPYYEVGEFEGVVICKVLHTPTNSNFWHFSLRWFYNEIDIDEWGRKEKIGAQRRILTSAKSFIVQNALFEINEFPIISKSLYSK